MRTYTLTDRDFEEFQAILEKIEAESKLKDGKLPYANNILDDLRRQYRYYLIGWRNRVTTGDSYARGPEPARDNNIALIKYEIQRLSTLLPKESL